MKRVFYQIEKNGETRTADINIYGDISSSATLFRNWGWDDGSVSARDIKAEIDGLDVDTINVYINSYGGEVAEALAIYSTLKRHRAHVNTYCDGFACSAATIIFCAGDTRTMGSIALMMIHNCMSYLGYANSEEMRKAAEDNDKINQSSIEAYKKVSNLSEEQIREYMNAETWLTAQECLEYGFATAITEDEDEETPEQSAFAHIRTAVLGGNKITNDSKLAETVTELCISVQQMMEVLQSAAEPQQVTHKNDFLKKLFDNL